MRTFAVALAALVGTGCSGGSTPASISPAPSSERGSSNHVMARAAGPVGHGWPTYHGDNERTGASSAAAAKPPLHRDWSRSLDGAVYAQPLVVGHRVIVATENDTVYALRRGTGHVLWRRHLGTPVTRGALPCGNIDPLGITGTPAFDAGTGSLLVVTETTGAHHTLRALSLRTGRPRWRRGLDVLAGRDRHAEQQRGALLVAHGRVYVPFGGLYGDCGDYVGYVTGTRTDGSGRTHHYAVPTARAAGIWAPPGAVQGKAGGDLFVAAGNGAQTNGSYDGSDSVIELTPKLRRAALFAPSTWAQDNAQDLDLGSMSPVVLSSGQVVIAGKRGTVYLVNRLHGVGSQRATVTGCPAYGGAASAGQVVFLPCDDGVRRLDVGQRSMRWGWRTAGVTGSPSLAGSAVYLVDQDRGDLVELRSDTGAIRARLHIGSVTRFATAVPVGRHVFVGTTSGVVAIGGSS
jgi:hypothetical protein